MPDHLHICLEYSRETVEVFIERWKSYTTHAAWKLGWVGKLWQPNKYPQHLNNEKAIQDVVQYILRNPEESAIVCTWKEYLYWLEP